MIHAVFININDNVPFTRVYKTIGMLQRNYKRMKNTLFDYAIDYGNFRVIREL